MAFKTIAIAGASGNVGTAAIPHLLKAGFTVTALVREGSSATFSDEVKKVEVDYSSKKSVTAALKGQDVVISALNPQGMGAQPLLIEVSTEVGVKRFIPAEWGGDTTVDLTEDFLLLKPKRDVQKLLQQKFKETGLTWTLIFTGFFFDWALQTDFMFNFTENTVKLYDDGKNPISLSSFDTIGRSVAAALLNPEETENKAVYVQSATVTIAKLFEYVQKYTPDRNWKVTSSNLEQEVTAATEALANGAPPFPSSLPQIVATIFGPSKYGQPWGPKNTTAKLGVKELSEEEVEEFVKKGLEARAKQ